MVASQLQTALESRVAIEQAKGILSERMAINVDAAFTLLRDHSRANNTKLTDTAREVVSGALLPATIAKCARDRRPASPGTD